MKSFTDIDTQELFWRQPKTFRMAYELRADTDTIAALRWEKPTGSLAHAECAVGEWTFKRAGFLRPHVIVRIPGATDDLAKLEINLSGTGTLRMADGTIYRWLNTSFWDGAWEFVTDDKTPLIRFRNAHMMMQAKGKVLLEPAASDDPHVPMLCCLGWYLLILMAADIATQNAIIS